MFEEVKGMYPHDFSVKGAFLESKCGVGVGYRTKTL